jgi:DNA-binding transcriptional regulator YdaS (Cro superfamily)
MSPKEALDHFKTQAEIARVLGVKPPSVSEWFDLGVFPEGRQYQLELATKGKLRADLPANRQADKRSTHAV